MRDKEEFFSILSGIDGAEFSEYIKLAGDFDFSRYVLKINQVPREGDGRSTLILVRVPQIIAGFPPSLFGTPVRRTALEDFLTRKISARIDALTRYDAEGISRRRMFIACPGQKILPRSSLVVTEEYIEARIYMDLPVQRGRITGDAAKEVFFDDLPAIVNSTLVYCNLDASEVGDFINLMEDADQVRQLLPTRGWVGFVTDGALLARAGGTDLPDYDQMVPLSVADDLAVSLDVPNAGTVRGFGVPNGVTVILGEVHSGRVDLIRALSTGIYNHIPGDGREMVITVPDAVYVAVEPGRSVQRVDISAFFPEYIGTKDVKQFSSSHAEPCAAQAASTVEALEAGARVLILDESDSAPEFLALDTRVAGLLPGAEKRATPLAMRARKIADELGVSIVIGGSAAVAEFIPVADTVLRVDGFKVSDVTKEAKTVAIQTHSSKAKASDVSGMVEKNRWVVPSSIDPSAGRFDACVDAKDTHSLTFGRSSINLRGIRQLADIYQTRTIGRILYYAKLRYMDEPRPIREILDLIDRDLSTEGLESLTRDLRGDLARPRRYEIAAALNRLDSLRINRAAD
jgi:predicted ABC-class ATPase